MRASSTPVSVRPHLPFAIRIADYLVAIVTVVLGAGSIALFAWPTRPVLVPLDLSPVAAIGWNALVSCVFFAQHSGLVRRSVRRRFSAIIPARYDGAFYAITSGIALTLFAVLVQPVGRDPLFVLPGLFRVVVDGAALLAVAGFVWGAASLSPFDPLGLRPIRQHLRSGCSSASAAPLEDKVLIVRGPYRFVRHPLYFFIIVLMWADPSMSAGRLEIAALWTAWICLGAWLEERDLAAEFGDRYRQYCRQVPMLLPRRRPVKVTPAR